LIYNRYRFFQENLCLPNPCFNSGICIATSFSTAICRCQTGFTGALCQYTNPCNSNPCRNQGQCLTLQFFSTTPSYRCLCSKDFTGLNCESNINLFCSSSSCMNGGTCSIDPTTSLTRCSCLPYFTGDFRLIFYNKSNIT